MKISFLLIFSIIFLNNCTAQTYDTLTIEYKAQTRGSLISLIINSNELVYTSNNKNVALKLSELQWEEIKNLVLKINLDSISKLVAPSTDSYTDKALIGSLKITKNNEIYESSTFDHGNPPIELKELIDYLFELVN